MSVTNELWPSLSGILVSLAAIAVITGIVVWRGRRRGSTTIVLDAALTVAAAWTMFAAAGAVIAIVKVFAVDFAEFHGPTTVYVDWPAGLPCSEFGGSGMLTCGGANLSDFTISGASLGLRMLAGAAFLGTQVLTAAPAAMLAAICFQTLRGRAFSTTVTRTLTVGAITVLVAGVASDLLSGIAATEALRSVLDPESPWYPHYYNLSLTPLPFVGALCLVALAAVFRQGMRLQRENEALQKDTEGLV